MYCKRIRHSFTITCPEDSATIWQDDDKKIKQEFKKEIMEGKYDERPHACNIRSIKEKEN